MVRRKGNLVTPILFAYIGISSPSWASGSWFYSIFMIWRQRFIRRRTSDTVSRVAMIAGSTLNNFP